MLFVIDGRKEDVLSVSSILYLSPLSISLKLTGTLSRFQMESGILTQSKEVLLKILYEGEGEDLLYQDIKVLKRKKKCLEYFSKYTPRHMCNIFLQSVKI